MKPILKYFIAFTMLIGCLANSQKASAAVTFTITPLNTGATTNITYGQTGIPLFGFTVKAVVTGSAFVWNYVSIASTSGVNAQSFFGNGRLLESTSGTTYPTNFTTTIASGGGVDLEPTYVNFTFSTPINCPVGTTTVSFYFVADFNQTYGTPQSTLNYFVANGNPNPFARDNSYNPYTYTGTTQSGASFYLAATLDWIGGSTDPSNKSNWVTLNSSTPPNGPGAADVLRFGVITPYNSGWPTYAGTGTINQLIFGSNATPTITVSSGTITVTNGMIFNAGATANITGSGAFTTTASVVTNTGSTVNLGTSISLTGTAGILTNGGTINLTANTLSAAGPSTNTGTITPSGTSVLSFTGTLDNTGGTINKTTTAALTFAGAVTNGAGGTITQNATAGLMKFSSTLNNTGTVNQNTTSGITFTGIVTNNAGGVINQNAASGGTAMTFSATTGQNNGGTINQNSTGTITFSGNLTNTGTIARAVAAGTGPINFPAIATLSNTGTITQNSSSLWTFPTGLTISNTGAGVIQNTSAGGITFTPAITNTTTANVINNGTGTITFSAAETAAQTSTGEIDLQSSGNIVFSSTLANAGTILSTGSGTVSVAGTLTNTGTFTGTGSGDLSVTGATTNTGTIKQSSTGDLIFAAVTNNSPGTITYGSGTSGSISGLLTNAQGATFNGPTSGGLLTMSGNNTVTHTNSGTVQLNLGVTEVNGNITNSTTGTFTSGVGKLEFYNTTQTQTVTNNNASYPFYFNNVTFSGAGKKILTTSGTGKFAVFSIGSLTVSGNISTAGYLATNNLLTLLSDTSGTAQVGALTSNTAGVITGNITAQRFVTGGTGFNHARNNYTYRNYRLLSSPVSNGTTPSNYYTLDYIANSAIVTGAGLSGQPNPTGSPTIYLYREDYPGTNASFTSGNFRGVSAFTTPTYTVGTGTGANNITTGKYIYPGNGFLFYFRGDKVTHVAAKTTAPYVAPESVVFSNTGTLNQGPISVVGDWGATTGSLTKTSVNTTVPLNQGLFLIGNPYASSINWDTAAGFTGTAAVSASIYRFNPITGNYDTYVRGNSGVGTGANGVQYANENIIVSGEGFFIQVTNTTPGTFIFNEAAKVTGANLNGQSGLLLNSSSGAATTAPSYIRVKLKLDSLNNDNVVIFLKNGSSTKYSNQEDAEDLGGSGALESLSAYSADSVALAINSLPFPSKTQVVPLLVDAVSSGTYTLETPEIKNIPAMYSIWLRDTYLNDSLDMRANPIYKFNIDKSKAATFGNSRFKIIINPDPTLQLHLLSFNASRASILASSVNVSWTVENEGNYTNFVVQRSTDNFKTFTIVNSFMSDSAGVYRITDNAAVNGTSQYRLQLTDFANAISYSPVVTIGYSTLSNNTATPVNLKVYPNPATDVINLSVLNETTASAYKMTITNSQGILLKTFNSAQPTWQNNVSALLPGTYFVQVVNTKNNTLIGSSTFVKL